MSWLTSNCNKPRLRSVSELAVTTTLTNLVPAIGLNQFDHLPNRHASILHSNPASSSRQHNETKLSHTGIGPSLVHRTTAGVRYSALLGNASSVR